MNRTSRGSILYIAVLVLVILVSSFSVVAGWKGSIMHTDFSAPFKKIVAKLDELTTSTSATKSTNADSVYKNEFKSSASGQTQISTSEAKISFKVVVTIAPVSRPTAVVIPTVEFITPTNTFPTIEPGAPGSKEWDEEFWRKWDEISKHNKEMEQQVDESHRQFCEQHPSFCN
ncbi:MAG: hypothetical protein ABIO02_02410 [Patescibacteria group bacterium]